MWRSSANNGFLCYLYGMVENQVEVDKMKKKVIKVLVGIPNGKVSPIDRYPVSMIVFGYE